MATELSSHFDQVEKEIDNMQRKRHSASLEVKFYARQLKRKSATRPGPNGYKVPGPNGYKSSNITSGKVGIGDCEDSSVPRGNEESPPGIIGSTAGSRATYCGPKDNYGSSAPTMPTDNGDNVGSAREDDEVGQGTAIGFCVGDCDEYHGCSDSDVVGLQTQPAITHRRVNILSIIFTTLFLIVFAIMSGSIIRLIERLFF